MYYFDTTDKKAISQNQNTERFREYIKSAQDKREHMNIQEAKETIEKALRAYFARDEIGFPLVPLRQQRPILLIGPPGIGKTAIMEQIAEECGVGLVAYTMTHHTRQSAMGLPEICTRGIEGKMVHTTEYTMSEIIASIYDCMEQTGKKRGILFLDEITSRLRDPRSGNAAAFAGEKNSAISTSRMTG